MDPTIKSVTAWEADLTKSELRYRPLPAHAYYTRLLYLLPGVTTDPLVCKLQIVDLDALQDTYTAVSYTWGKETPSFQISVDGRQLQVRQNLSELLHEFRSPIQTLSFWIDAICIDQRSVGERNHQVKLMGIIFGRADEVRSWLGPASPKDNEAFDCIEQLSEFEQTQIWPPPVGLAELCNQSLRLISGKPYWSRSWIVQELVLGNKVFIHCGSRRCAWYEILRLCSWDEKDAATNIRAIEQTRKDSDLSITTSFHRFGHLGCSISHDKFYSLHGVLERNKSYKLPNPNYNLCLTQVIGEYFTFVQNQLVLSRLMQPRVTAEEYGDHPFTFLKDVARSIPPMQQNKIFCACHSPNLIVTLRLPFRGYIQHAEGQQSSHSYRIYREHDIYRFRRFTSPELRVGDLAFEISSCLFLVVRQDSESSQDSVQIIHLVHHSRSGSSSCYLSKYLHGPLIQHKDSSIAVQISFEGLLYFAERFASSSDFIVRRTMPSR